MSEPAADPNHKGNSPEYHTGKPCTVNGCKEPAGTWWGPHWCQKHNAERLARIGANLDDMIKRVELRREVEKETESLRDLLYKAYAENFALIAACGGKITVTQAHKDAKATRQSAHYGKDGSTTYDYWFEPPVSPPSQEQNVSKLIMACAPFAAYADRIDNGLDSQGYGDATPMCLNPEADGSKEIVHIGDCRRLRDTLALFQPQEQVEDVGS